jgi:hypothetical protein
MKETPTAPARKSKRRWFRIGCLTILVIALIAVLWPVFWREPQYVSRPETGFAFPDQDQIRSIVIDSFFPIGTLDAVEVPREHWASVLNALQPSQVDYFPMKWAVMGDMRIQTTSGKTIYVQLFGVSHAKLGAFTAGEDGSRQTYYRGGNSDELEAAIGAALPEREPEDMQ